MATGDELNLLMFFNRPQEPCFLPKGKEMAAFEIPPEYYPSTFRNFINKSCIKTKLKVVVKSIMAKLPDLTLLLKLPFNANFSLFIPEHREMAGRLIRIFMEMPDVTYLISLCSYCQLRVNPYMFNYCLSVAILHRADTKDLVGRIPSLVESFPDKFFDPEVFRKAKEASMYNNMYGTAPQPVPIAPKPTAAEWNREQRCWYFREDLGVNLHHWHWHLVYPTSANNINIVDKNRRGELFYYMHQQIVARYNIERMCNGLRRVLSLNDFSQPIEEGYFPKLDSLVASRTWPSRFKNAALKDLNRPNVKLTVCDLGVWRDRIKTAIETLCIKLPDGSSEPLDETTGIDVLGNLIEATVLSRNSDYYGNLHNMGHNFLALCHDPDGRYLEESSVMGDTVTAMRDPVFYRWHTFIDDLFQLYKSKLAPYGNDKLDNPGICCSSISIEAANCVDKANVLNTRWDLSTVDIGRGLDFLDQASFQVQFRHLQHNDFTYVIEVNNTTCELVMGTVRIFMAPTQNEDGQAFSFEEQRRLMIELDKFTVPLNPGMSTIRQKSTESSVTIPFDRIFSTGINEENPTENFCRCGWPHYMLLPKGTKEGYPMVLFVMISNWKDDKVDQKFGCKRCENTRAASYCGIQDGLYPDKRAMGFPFDRRAPPGVLKLGDFLTPNTATREVSVKFTDDADNL